MGSRASFCSKRAKHHSPANESAGQPTVRLKANGEDKSPSAEATKGAGSAKHDSSTGERTGQPTGSDKSNRLLGEGKSVQATGALPAGSLAKLTNPQLAGISRAKGKGADWSRELDGVEEEKQGYDNMTYLTYVTALESFALVGLVHANQCLRYHDGRATRKLWDALCAMPTGSLRSSLLCEGRLRLPQHPEVDGSNLIHLLAMFDSGPDRASSDADSWFNFVLTKLTDNAGNERLREAAAVVRGEDGSAVQIACVREANRVALAMIQWGCDFSSAGIPFHACVEREQWEIASAILSSSPDPNIGDPLTIIGKRLPARLAEGFIDSTGTSERASAFVRQLLARIGDPKRVPFQFFDAVRDLLRQLHGERCGDRIGSLLCQQSVTPQDQGALASTIVKGCEPFFIQTDRSWFQSLLLHGSVLYAKHRLIGSRTIRRTLVPVLPPELASIVDSFIS